MSESEQSYSSFPDFSSGNCGFQPDFGQIPLPEALYYPRFVRWGGSFDHENDSRRDQLLGSLVRYGNELERGDMSPENKSRLEDLDYALGRIIEISADANPSAVSWFELPPEVRGNWFRVFFYDRDDEPGQGLSSISDPLSDSSLDAELSSVELPDTPSGEVLMRKIAMLKQQRFARNMRFAVDQAVLDVSTAALGSDDMT